MQNYYPDHESEEFKTFKNENENGSNINKYLNELQDDLNNQNYEISALRDTLIKNISIMRDRTEELNNVDELLNLQYDIFKLSCDVQTYCNQIQCNSVDFESDPNRNNINQNNIYIRIQNLN